MGNETEEWRDVVGYEGLYEVSSLGRVRNVGDPRYIGLIMATIKSKAGYLRVGLSNGRKRRMFTSHRLVALAFVPNPEKKPQINHKDGNKMNNHPSNLEWCTAKEDRIHAVKHGLAATGLRHGANTKPESRRTGVKNGRAKLSETDVVNIRAMIAAGLGNKQIAEQFSVCQATVWWIKKGHHWRTVA